jgi:hypothetical protein
VPLEAGEGEPLNALVALDESGNGWVTWTQTNGTRKEVRARHYDGAAATWGTEEIIDGGSGSAAQFMHQYPGAGAGPCRLQSTSSGARTIASWLDGAFPESGTPRVSLHDREKGGWTATSLGAAGATQVRAAVGADGSAAASWVQGGLKISTYRGGAWAAETTIYPGEVSLNGEILVSADGTVIASWSTKKGVFVSKGRDQSFSEPVLISSEIDRAGGVSHLARLPEGGVLAVWIQSDGISDSVFWSRLDATMNAWLPAAKVERLPEAATNPALATNAAGSAVAAWSTGTFQNGHTFATLYRSGAGWSTPVMVDNAGQYAPRVGIDAAGTAMVVISGVTSVVKFTQTRDGITWTPIKDLPTTKPVPPSQWELAVAANGGAVVVWRDSVSAGEDLKAQVYQPAH